MACLNTGWREAFFIGENGKSPRSRQLDCTYICVCCLAYLCQRHADVQRRKGICNQLECLGVLVYFLCLQEAYSPFTTGALSAIHTWIGSPGLYQVKWDLLTLDNFIYRHGSLKGMFHELMGKGEFLHPLRGETVWLHSICSLTSAEAYSVYIINWQPTYTQPHTNVHITHWW